MELVLGDTLAHGAGARDAAGDHLEELVAVVGAAPLLVLDDVDAAVHLGLLDELAVGAHAVLGVGAGELVADEGRRVQAGQGDELPAVAQRGQAADVRLLLVAGHGRLPVERGGEVVSEPEGEKKRFHVRYFSSTIAESKRDANKEKTYFCSGQTAWTPLANSCACLKSGSLLSIQMASQ